MHMRMENVLLGCVVVETMVMLVGKAVLKGCSVNGMYAQKILQKKILYSFQGLKTDR